MNWSLIDDFNLIFLFAFQMVETQVVKGSVTPLTVSAQYLSATTIVKPVVVVSGAHTPPPAPAPSNAPPASNT